jgi:signal transduction histidine kinase
LRSPSCSYASSALDADFPRLVSLACHDLRTPLATVQGFAKTMVRLDDLEEAKLKKYLGLIDTASDELALLLELLSLAARIEGGRYEPVTREADSLELARAAVPDATGTGAPVQVEPDAVERALASLARAATRHGGVEVLVSVDGPRIRFEPVLESAAPIVLAENQKDLGAAVAVSLVRVLGGQLTLEGERLTVELPTAAGETTAGL